MPLNRREMIQLVRAIEERREVLLAEIQRGVARSREAQYPDLAGTTHDSGDEAVADVIADLDHAEVTRDLGELRKLDAAVKRVTDGSYGVCIDCRTEIPLERLRAQAGAERCLECQERHEKTYKTL